MPHCMVPGCHNGKVRTKVRENEISFHRLPKDKKMSKIWLQKSKITKKPKEGSCYICSKHFSSECFEQSFRYLCGQKDKRKLKPGSIPTIFNHKKDIRKRLFSIKRRKAKDKREVRKTYMKKHTIVCTSLLNKVKIFWYFLNFV